MTRVMGLVPVALLLLVVVLCLVFLLEIDQSHGRRLDTPYKRHFEYNGKRVKNTTTPDLYKDFMEILHKRQSYYEKGKALDPAKIGPVVDQIQSELGWNKTTNDFNNLLLVNQAIHKLNNFDWKITNDPTMSELERKRLDEYVSNDYAVLSEEIVNSMFDIIVLTGNTSLEVNFLNDWKEAVENVHVIIIQQGDPNRVVEVPSWVNFELYTKPDVIKAVGEDAAWIFDMDGNSASALNFGFLVADREFVFVLDRDCLPINRPRNFQKLSTSSDSSASKSLFGLFRLHADNLMRPSAPYYYNNQDPYTTLNGANTTNDYVRGFPYEMREGIQSMISYGSVYHHNDVDALTRFMKPGAIQPRHNHHKGGGGVTKVFGEPAHPSSHEYQSHSNNHNDMVVTVPHRTLFSLSLKNVAFHRRVFGPALCLVGAAGSKVDYPIGPNYEIIAGWIMKKVADHIGAGIKHAVNPVFLAYTGDHTVSDTNPTGELFEEMKSDLLWLAHHEEVAAWFSSVELPGKSRDDVGGAVYDLANKMRSELSAIHPVYKHIADVMTIYSNLFNKRNGFHSTYLPVSSRSSLGPAANSTHKCAAFTIVHNETDMKDVWIRYYGKHLPNALFILNHQSGNDAAANRITFNPAVLGGPNTARVDDLYGDGAGFPMGFLVGTADRMQRRLLRYGYKCVVLTDVDEMLVPDPVKYPGGLSEYLTSFVNNPTTTVTRAEGWILAHVTEADKTVQDNVEPPIDWTKPIMGQRHFRARQPKYDKPLVSKIPCHYKPGFHTTFIPAVISQDTDLQLFHLRELDKEFCLGREYNKYMLIRRAHQSELDKALNGHINNFPAMVKSGETCQFGNAYARADGSRVDRTGKVVLDKLDDKWRNVVM